MIRRLSAIVAPHYRAAANLEAVHQGRGMYLLLGGANFVNMPLKPRLDEKKHVTRPQHSAQERPAFAFANQ